MNKTLLTIGVLFAGLILFCIITAFAIMNTYNRAAQLKNQYEMKVIDNTSEFDNCWKKIQQTAQVTDAQKVALREIFEGYASARNNGSSNNIMTWIKESVPNVDISVYKNLQNIITGSRDAWTMRQKELVGIAQEYNKNLVTFPSNIILKMFGFEKITPKIITSNRTDKAFETGQDNDVDLPLKR